MRNNFLFGDKYDMNSLFASTARGLEELLKSELETLGAHDCKVLQGGVHFQGDDRLLYQSLLWSRLASRILLPLNEFRVHSDLDLYLGVQAIDWPSIFGVDKTFAVHFSGVNEEIRNSQYGALKVKDAIVDSFTRKLDQRPTVAKQQPDIRVNVFLQRDMASVALDLSGEGLHQRGYRDLTGQAPLKENLAAAIVLRSGWQPGTPMLDPMCGSGTLLIEAAMIAADRAPGLHRQHWGFSAWNGHNAELWREVTTEAQVRARRGLHRNDGGVRVPGRAHDHGVAHVDAGAHPLLARRSPVRRGVPDRQVVAVEADHQVFADALGVLLGTEDDLEVLAVAPDAPRNTASRMLSIMAVLIRRERPEVTTLVSYHDTEVHTGCIYRAAGWKKTAVSGKGDWNRPNSRNTNGTPRTRPKAQSEAKKQRWEKCL